MKLLLCLLPSDHSEADASVTTGLEVIGRTPDRRFLNGSNNKGKFKRMVFFNNSYSLITGMLGRLVDIEHDGHGDRAT